MNTLINPFPKNTVGGDVVFYTANEFERAFGLPDNLQFVSLDDVATSLENHGYAIFYASCNPDDILNIARDEEFDLSQISKTFVVDDQFYISVL